MEIPIEIKDDRYSRLDIISWWDRSILSKAHIMVVGCGALGNEIIKNLAMLGVGNIYVVDMDRVEKSNLTRSVLFRKEDEGKGKAETAAKRAKEINDEVNIKFYDGSIFELGLGVFKKMDLVICGLDNREARLFVNQSCWKVTTPWIDGAIEVLSGVARMFIPPDGVDYESTMTEIDYQLLNHRKSCMLLGIEEIEQGMTPTTPTIASIIGAMQVQEAVKYLHKQNDMLLLDGKGFVYNGMTNDSYIVEYQVREDCNSRYTFGVINEAGIDFSEAKLRDVYEFGQRELGDDFNIDFNNEVVYELFDEVKQESNPYFANFNLLKLSDIKTGETIQKAQTFNTLHSKSELYTKLSGSNLMEMKLPVNDILILRKGSTERYLEFGYEDPFKDAGE
ncbi:MAG TPA: ThiF family adenylyltransferase [Ignavibacteria bacterium]|nr:ThiF family adenylyltransferase [Ignavibacteria bacterium]